MGSLKKVTQAPNPKSLLIISGEVSGDLFASHLVSQLKSLTPLSVGAVGGDQLERVSDTFISHIAKQSIIGLGAFFQRFTLLSHLKKNISNYCTQHNPVLAIIVDFQYHNHIIAKHLQQLGIPIVTYITPNYWMWKDVKNAKIIANYSQAIICIFKPEYEFYQQFSDAVYYFGHPFNDLFSPQNLPKKRGQIAFFPGSRKQEFERYAPVFLKAIKKALATQPFHAVLSLSQPDFKAPLLTLMAAENIDNIQLWEGDAASLLAQSEGAVIASGSLTLEALLTKIPMVIVGALKPVTYFVAKYIVRLHIPFVSLPNLLAQKEIVPELIQGNITTHAISSHIHQLIHHQLSTDHYDEALTHIKGDTPFFKSATLIVSRFL